MLARGKALVVPINVVAEALAQYRALVEESPVEEYLVLGEDPLLEDDDGRGIVALKRALDEDLLARAIDVEDALHLEARQAQRRSIVYASNFLLVKFRRSIV